MQCPHCLHHFFSEPRRFDLGPCGEDQWALTLEACPNCNDATIILYRRRPVGIATATMVYPKGTGRPALPTVVPWQYASDYQEAARLLPDSPQASAAVSRHCLRRLFHETIGMCSTDFARELDLLLASRQLPRYLADALDAVRNFADFAAHPEKGTTPGAISDVQPGEAEWLLDTLDALFNFYFVQPAETERRRTALLGASTRHGRIQSRRRKGVASRKLALQLAVSGDHFLKRVVQQRPALVQGLALRDHFRPFDQLAHVAGRVEVARVRADRLVAPADVFPAVAVAADVLQADRRVGQHLDRALPRPLESLAIGHCVSRENKTAP